MDPPTRITGLNETLANLRAFSRRVNRGRGLLVRRFALKIERRAKENLQGGPSGPRRIDTGFLRGAIHTRLHRIASATVAEIVSGASYSVHVHYGTTRMAANRYLEEALEFYRQDFIDAVKDLIRRAARSQGGAALDLDNPLGPT